MDEGSGGIHDPVNVGLIIKGPSGRNTPTVSSSDLTIHETHPSQTVIKNYESTPQEEKRNGVICDPNHRKGYLTSSSNDLSLNVDNTQANCLPPEYCVSLTIIKTLTSTLIESSNNLII